MFKRLPFLLFSILLASPFFSLAQNPGITRSGYQNISELTVARGFIHENTDISFGFQTINGYRFNEHIAAGIGVGVDKYTGKKNLYGARSSRTLTLLPVFTDMHIYLGKGKVQPFFAQAVGYAFCVDQPVDYDFYGEYDEKGGIMLNPSFGFAANLGGRTNLNISLGYRYQENTQEISNSYRGYYSSYIPDGALFKRFDHYLTFKAGLSF